MTDDPSDDLKKFVLTPELLAELGPLQKKPKPQPARPARAPRTGRFIQLPYERTLAAAGQIKAAPLAVLIELTWRRFKSHQNPVTLANKALRAVGISHEAKNRALRQLEAAGLITITWRGRGRSPLVTLLWE